VRVLPLLVVVLAPLVASPPPVARVTQIRIPLWMEAKAPAADDPPGNDLSPTDFHATIDGVASRILSVKCPDDDLIILLVLDLSSGDLTLADPAKDALAAEIQKLKPRADVGLLRAQDGLHVLLDPTADRDAAIQAIEQQTFSGKAGLLATVDTMGRIADAMLGKSPVRVAIIYITDGDVRNYREDFTNPVINSSDSHDLSRRFPETLVQEKISKLNAALAMQQTPLFIVGLSWRGDRLNEAYQNGMKELAETTGGGAFFSRSTTEIPAAIQESFRTAVSHYSLTLALPERVSDRPQIRVTVPENGRGMSYRSRLVLHKR